VNVIDVALVVLVVAGAVLEARRGFGRALFDFVALLVAVRGVSLLAPPVASALHIAKDVPANEAIWYGILFVVVGGILVFLGKLAYDATLISLDTLDPLLGGVLGIGAAVVIGHVIVKALAVSAGIGGTPPEVLATSPLGMEFYRFVTYHKVIDFLASLPK